MRNINRMARLALEQFAAVASLSADLQQPLQCPTEQLGIAIQGSDASVNDLQQHAQNILALESLGRSLKSKDASTMGKMGMRYFNLAVENYASSSGIDLQELPLKVDEFDQNADQALAATMQRVSTIGAGIQEGSRESLIQCLGFLMQKKEALNKAVRDLHHRLDEINEDLQGLKDKGALGASTQGTLGDSTQYRHICYSNRGIISKGAGVADDVVSFLKAHSALYSQLIKKQSEWVRQHKDNVLLTQEGVSSYIFNPKDYLLPGSIFVTRDNGEAVFRSAELPGGVYFFTSTAEVPVEDADGVECLANSRAWMGTDPYATIRSQDAQAVVLSPVELEARVKEVRMALVEMGRWVTCVYSDLWKDAFFDEVISAVALKHEASTLHERVFGLLAAAVVKMLNEASGSTVLPILNIFDDMLRYMEDSIRIHVPKHIDGA